MAELTGQVALVTGASTGIGRHLVEGLAARGMAVAGLARGEERLRRRWPRSPRPPAPARWRSPPTSPTGRRSSAAVARVAAELGPVDLLVNNAGLIDAAEVPLWEADPDQWWDVVASHVRGRASCSAAPSCRGCCCATSGRIVNLASGMSMRANREYSAYSVAKTGLMRMTEALAGALEGSDVHGLRRRARRRGHRR